MPKSPMEAGKEVESVVYKTVTSLVMSFSPIVMLWMRAEQHSITPFAVCIGIAEQGVSTRPNASASEKGKMMEDAPVSTTSSK